MMKTSFGIFGHKVLKSDTACHSLPERHLVGIRNHDDDAIPKKKDLRRRTEDGKKVDIEADIEITAGLQKSKLDNGDEIV